MNKKIVNLRFIAILLVVVGHSIIIYDTSWGVFSTKYSLPYIETIKKIINLIQMPLFFSISGFLMYYSLIKEKSLIRFIKNKFIRIIIPFFSVLLLWVLPIRFLINYNNYQNTSFLKILCNNIIMKDSSHLWYLPTLFAIFIISFIILKKISIKKYMCIFMLSFLFLLIHNCFPSYIGHIFHYYFYFLIGYFINFYKIYISKKLLPIFFFIIFLLFIYNLFFKNFLLQIFFQTLFIIVIYTIICNKTNQIIETISKKSYGIYLFHSPLVYISYTYYPNIQPLLMLLFNIFICGGLSFLLACILSKTKLKFLIGD